MATEDQHLWNTLVAVGLHCKYWECCKWWAGESPCWACHGQPPPGNTALSVCWSLGRGEENPVAVLCSMALVSGSSRLGRGFGPRSETPLWDVGVRCRITLGQIPASHHCVESCQELPSPLGHPRFSGVTPALAPLSHRITEWFGLEGTLQIISFHPPPWGRTPSPSPGCSEPWAAWARAPPPSQGRVSSLGLI